jgi:AraC-like DNA-binding protein
MLATPFSSEARVYPANKIAAIVGVLAEAGVAAADVLSGSGLAPERLHDLGTRVSYAQLRTVCRNALRLSPDSGVALRAGLRMHLTAYGMYGYALLSSRTGAECAEFGLKYHPVMGPVCNIEFSLSGDIAVYRLQPVLSADPADELYRFAVEFYLASHLTVNRDLLGPSFRFSAVRVVYEAPPHASLYGALLDCPVSFGESANELRWDAVGWGDAIVTSDPITHAMAREMCEQNLSHVRRAGGIAAEVHRVLIERPGRHPDIESMALALGMNSRTLRRRLEADQTSYRQILAEVHAHLAIEYLRKTDMTTEEIAYRLDYSDAANFRRAFKRWTQHSPTHFRSR